MSKIVVIGSTNMDLVAQVPHYPAAGETLFGTSFTTIPGGKGANQAVAVARIGSEVSFMTKLGNDAFGQQMRQHFSEEGMDMTHILTDTDSPTGTALITVEEKGENRIIVIPGANARLSEKDLENLSTDMASCDFVLTQLEIPLPTVIRIAEMASLQKIFLITPNETEAEILTGIRVRDTESARQAAQWFRKKGVKQVIITLGAQGAFVFTDEFQGIIPAYKVKATDTTAAGDVFNGALTVALSEGKNTADAARFGCAASALAVMRPGAQSSIPTRTEIDAFLA